MTLRDLGWPVLVALVLSPVCLSLALFSGSEFGGGEYWPLSAIGAVAVFLAIVIKRQWLALLLLVPLAAPLFKGSLLLVACLIIGDCI